MYVLFLPDEGDHSIIETLQLKVLRDFLSSTLSEYRAGAICFVICGKTEYLGSLWGREGVEGCWNSRLVSLYSVIQTLWSTRCGSRPWTRDSPGLRSSPHATSVLGRSLPLTIRWTMAIPASPLPQTLKMAAYLASVGLKTVLVSYIRNLTLSVKCPTPRTCNFWSKLILKTPIIYMLHCTSSLKLLTFFVSFSALCNVYVHHMHRFVYSKEVGVMYITVLLISIRWFIMIMWIIT